MHLLFVIGMASLLVFVYEIYASYFHTDTYGQKSNEKIKALPLQDLIRNGSPFQGKVSAPITIIDFSDFQCYLCNRFVKNTEPLMNQSYIQTRKVALVFNHLPNRGFDSMGAALAAQCTNDQGKFWQFHNLLYSNQKAIDSGWVSKENLKNFASLIPRLDIKRFDRCFVALTVKSTICSKRHRVGLIFWI